jgi:hypothetical protein
MWVRADVIGLLSVNVGSRNAMLSGPPDYIISPLHLAYVWRGRMMKKQPQGQAAE